MSQRPNWALLLSKTKLQDNVYIYYDLISTNPEWELHLYMCVDADMYGNECLKLTRIRKRGVLPDAMMVVLF